MPPLALRRLLPLRTSAFGALRVLLPGLATVALVLLAACGDSPSEPAPDVVVSVSPSSATVNAGESTQLTATVSNATNSGVTWTSTGGTVSPSGTSATWTAPGTGGSFTVTATSVADPSKRASATLTVTPVGVSVAPATSTVGAGDTLSVTASVTSTATDAVTWTASAGTIVGTGATVLWVAPVAGGAYTITATSVLDPTRSANAAVTVTPVVVSVSPTTATLYRGEPTTLAATVTGTGDASVTWASDCGTITGSGASVTFTASDTPGACAARATSVRNPAISADVVLTVRSAYRVAAMDDTDDGSCTYAHCSLREALTVTNGTPAADSIVLLAPTAGVSTTPRLTNATDATITLTAALPFISSPLTLVGPGASALAINANATVANQRGVLYFTGEGMSTVRGLTLRGGVRAGGGGLVIDENANVTLRDVEIRENESVSVAGGGLLALRGGRGTLVDVIVADNRASGAGAPGAGISVEPGSMIAMLRGRIEGNETTASFGGGVRVFNGALMLDSVLVRQNKALTTQGGLGIGGGVFMDGPDAVLQTVGARFEENAAGVAGGGLSVRGGGTATMTGTVVHANTAPVAAGIEVGDTPLMIMNGTITENVASQRGGGILLFGNSELVFTGGAIRANVAQSQGGGGLYVQGFAEVGLTDVAIDANQAIGGTGGSGGGLFVSAAGSTNVSIKNGSLSDNVATQVGGAIYAANITIVLNGVTVERNTGVSAGGAMFLQGTAATIRDGRVAGNAATGGGGGAVFFQSGTLLLEGVTFAENSTSRGGAAVLGLTSGEATIRDVIAEDNTAVESGGAFGFDGTFEVLIERGIVRRNATSNGSGGGLWKRGNGSLVMLETHVLNNTAAFQGGGVQLAAPGAPGFFLNVTMRGNVGTAASGGGLSANVPVIVTGSTFADNTSGGIGGGLYTAAGGNASIVRSTFSANSAVFGGGVAAVGPANLLNVTFVGNRATDYGGAIGTNNAGAMEVQASLLSGNLVNGVAQNCGTGGTSTIASLGSNLSDDTSCSTFTQPSDITNTPAGVSPTLADNGGLTFTHALLAGSAAIDAITDTDCTANAADQRGYLRAGTGCDIGAFEFGGVAPMAPAQGRARAQAQALKRAKRRAGVR